MKTPARRSAFRPTVVVIVLIAAGIAFAPSTAGAATSTWQLVDLHDRRCTQLGGGGTPGSYAVEISGRWTHALTVGMDGLPAGVTATPLQSPIAPGTSDGAHELAYVRVGVNRRQASVGTYTLTLWASDGTTRRSVGVTLVLQSTRCTAY